ncbi:MAG: hypothetical protein WAZ27_00050 [Minisyncoccia bacterium]
MEKTPAPEKASAEIIDLAAERKRRNWAESRTRLAEVAGPAIELEYAAFKQAKENAQTATKDFYEVYASIEALLKADALDVPLLRRDAARIVNIVEYIESTAGSIPSDLEEKVRDLIPVLQARFKNGDSPSAA